LIFSCEARSEVDISKVLLMLQYLVTKKTVTIIPLRGEVLRCGGQLKKLWQRFLCKKLQPDFGFVAANFLDVECAHKSKKIRR
jgi:hypothetical protein